MSDIALENIERISSGWTKASVDMGPPKDGIILNRWNVLAGQRSFPFIIRMANYGLFSGMTNDKFARIHSVKE
jgi:hypothetical protein